MAEPAPFVLILGMHRSGTSCLAGSLERSGLHLGDVRRTGRHNERGYYESSAIVRTHDQILALNRGAWDEPPDDVRVHAHHRAVLEDTARELARHGACGIKDPRQLLLLDEWLAIAPPGLRLVGTFRHPAAVVASLARRNGMSEQQALALWCTYNERLVRQHRAAPFPLLRFDLGDHAGYVRDVAKTARDLGLRPDVAQLRRFIGTELEHFNACELPLPARCRETYAYLEQHRIQTSGPVQAVSSWSQAAGALREFAFTLRMRLPEQVARSGVAIAGWRPPAVALRQGELPVRLNWLFGLFARAARACSPQSFVLFVGNPRSGTTLVKSLLDAHPAIVLGNEVHALKRMSEGESWEKVVGRIVISSRAFGRNPTWTGHDYGVAWRAQRNARRIRVVGDKKAQRSAAMFAADPQLLDRIAEWSRAPLRMLHIVRHPLDAIASQARARGFALGDCVAEYFDNERTAADICRRLGPVRARSFALEQLIAEPEATLGEMLAFLGVQVEPGHMQACGERLYRQPNSSRDAMVWPASLLADIEARIGEIPHLQRYRGSVFAADLLPADALRDRA